MSQPHGSAEAKLHSELRAQLPQAYAVYRNVAWLTKAVGDDPRDGEADFVVAHPDAYAWLICQRLPRADVTGHTRWTSTA